MRKGGDQFTHHAPALRERELVANQPRRLFRLFAFDCGSENPHYERQVFEQLRGSIRAASEIGQSWRLR
jgi:hypothetical protein